MKKLFKIILSLVTICLILILIDLYLLRGYLTPNLLSFIYTKNSKAKEIKNKDCNLFIKKEGDFYNLTFENKSYKPFLIWTYRNEKPLFKVNDSIFFQNLRYKSYFPQYKNDYHYGLDCGTGAGFFAINSYESFQIKKTYKELIKFIYWRSVHQYNIENDTIKDLIYNKPLLLTDRRKEFKIFERNDLTEKDSTEVQFYIPLFSFDHKKLSYIKSNKIRLSYKDIINNLTVAEKKIHQEFKMF
jgi:hypothetical protein